MAEDVVQAVRDQLVSWLKSQLQTTFPTLSVLQEWPGASALPSDFVITVLAQEPGVNDYHFHPPKTVSVTPGTSPNGAVTYVYGRLDNMPLVLDCFAASPAKRDQLARELRKQLKVHPAVSLGTGDGVPRLGRYPSLSLALAGMYGAICTYRFSPVASPQESSDTAQRNDWRTTFRGHAMVPLLDQDPSFPLLQKFGLKFTTQQDGVTLEHDIQGSVMQVVVTGALNLAASRPTVQLKATAIYDSYQRIDASSTAAWQSSNPAAATVNSSGLVTRVASGSTTITATIGGKSAHTTILVG